MATAEQSDDENYSSGSDISDVTDSDEFSDPGSSSQKQPCKYYNKGTCRDGDRCPYLHVCSYALKGNCRYGSSCKLNHSVGSGKSHRMFDQTASSAAEETDVKLTDGRLYQWQLNDGSGWMDIDNDQVIEAQYTLPHTKGIKIYNTPYGVVSIDFEKMKVYGKNLKVRRLDDGNTEWIWYCTLRGKWVKYSEKNWKGSPNPVQSSDIEKKFQSNPTSSFTFIKDGETFEIRFREMQQVGKSKKRKVTRRPSFLQLQANPGASGVAAGLQNVSLGTKPQWQFEGDRGAWHEFKNRSGTSNESTVSSDDIERKYQQNPRDSMTFKVNGQAYKLDFTALTQTNIRTQNVRRIRRVLV